MEWTKTLRSLSAKTDTAGAIKYVLSHWRALTHYIDDGLLEIDNSSAERPLRAVAIGRLLAALAATRIRLAAPHFSPDTGDWWSGNGDHNNSQIWDVEKKRDAR